MLLIKKLLVIAFSFQLLAFFNLAQAAWQEPKFSPPWCGTTNNIGCFLPITASLINQVKVGGFGTNGPLSGPWVFAINKLGIGPGADSVAELDPTAVLDVDGQVRIRGTAKPPPLISQGFVLESQNSGGLAKWVDVPPTFSESSLQAGYGVVLDWTGPPDNYYTVSLDPAKVQKRITGTCRDGPDAVTSVGEDGAVTCRSGVTKINVASGGLTGGGSGPQSLVVNVGAPVNAGGLIINSNTLKVEAPMLGDGLLLSSLSDNYLRFSTTTNCGLTYPTRVYWKYNSTDPLTPTTGWGCSNPYPPSPTPTGEGVMYLRRDGTPPECPTSNGWTAIPTIGTEYTSSGGIVQNIRVCYNTANLCQVFELKALFPNNPASCPSGWSSISTNESVYGSYNYVNVCYRCVAP